MSLSWKQAAGWAGVGYSVILVAGLVIFYNEAPTFSDSPAAFREFFSNNEMQIAWLTVGFGLALVLTLLFASGLRSILGPADSASQGLWARFSFAGAVMYVSVAGVGWAFWAVLALDDVLAVASDETVRTLTALFTVVFSAIVPWARAAFMVGASVVILRSGVMGSTSKWIGWFGLLTPLLLVVDRLWSVTGDPEGLSLFSTELFLVWTLVIAVTMIRSSTSTASA